MPFIAFSRTFGYGKHAFWPTGGEANKYQNLISKSETNPNAQNTKSKTAEQKISQMARVWSIWLLEF
jgi:hypothetical protein